MSASATHAGLKRLLMTRLRMRLLAGGALRAKPPLSGGLSGRAKTLESLCGRPLTIGVLQHDVSMMPVRGSSGVNGAAAESLTAATWWATHLPLIWRRHRPLRGALRAHVRSTPTSTPHLHLALNLHVNATWLTSRVTQLLHNSVTAFACKAPQRLWRAIRHESSARIGEQAVGRHALLQANSRPSTLPTRSFANRMPSLSEHHSIFYLRTIRESTGAGRSMNSVAASSVGVSSNAALPLATRRQVESPAQHPLKTIARAPAPTRFAGSLSKAMRVRSATPVAKRGRPATLSENSGDITLPFTFPTRRAEIVWRRVPDGDSSDAQPAMRSAPGRANTFNQRATASASGAAGFVTSTAATSSAAFRLDPGIADRLAEDVIHRVERRVRIERERRGL